MATTTEQVEIQVPGWAARQFREHAEQQAVLAGHFSGDPSEAERWWAVAEAIPHIEEQAARLYSSPASGRPRSILTRSMGLAEPAELPPTTNPGKDGQQHG